MMRENIIEQLRFCAAHFSCDGCGGNCKSGSNEPRTKAVLNDATDAIEELLARDVVPTDFHERSLQLEIRKRLELEKQMPHWISVEERLPAAEDGDPWDRCIVYTDEDTIQTLPLCKVGNGYVTHWMKVEPPKEVE